MTPYPYGIEASMLGRSRGCRRRNSREPSARHENVKDFAEEVDLVIVCVLKSRLRQKGMAEHLAGTLDAWAQAHPDPYLGLHRPAVSPRRR
jgi:hypothetical protein